MPWTTDLIRTDRMTLRCPTEADRPAVRRILTDEDVRRYLGGPIPAEDADAFDSHQLGNQPGLFAATLTREGTTIGTFSLEDGRDEIEISYQLLPEFWGLGYAIEAADALLQWGWTAFDIDSVIAVTQTVNERSLHLLDRLGFLPDRQFEEHGAMQTQMRLIRPS